MTVGQAWLPRRLLLPVHMGNVNPVDQDETKMIIHKVALFATIVALLNPVTLLIKFLGWNYIQGKNFAILAAMLRKRSYFLKKPFFQSVHWENFHPVVEILAVESKRVL